MLENYRGAKKKRNKTKMLRIILELLFLEPRGNVAEIQSIASLNTTAEQIAG
jgi:hypothetical protein